MADPQILNWIAGNFSSGDRWEASCFSLLESSDYDWTTGLVDGSGRPVFNLTSNTRGINLQTCYNYCGEESLPFATNFQFDIFSAAATSYFLPWIALAAQLPFETGDPGHNFVSLCLAIGSPALITYSLSLTVMNRAWIRKSYGSLVAKAQLPFIRDKRPHDANKIRALMLLLQEAQQVPLRFFIGAGQSIERFIASSDTPLWENLEERLISYRRGFSSSLVTQMAVAIISYLLTVISSFAVDLGSGRVGNQISAGILWSWLVPVISGWILVGIQAKHDSIEQALKGFWTQRASQNGCRRHVEKEGFWVETGSFRDMTQTRATAGPSLLHREMSKPPPWLGARVEGDEEVKGPTYNYARGLTWWHLAKESLESIHISLDAVCCDAHSTDQQSKTVGSSTTTTRSPTKENTILYVEETFPSVEFQCESVTGNHIGQIAVYPEWSQVPAEVYHRMFAASISGLLLQWAIVGSAIWVGYMTPTVGVGCRTGSYLLYGALGTLTWFLLSGSSLLSHAVMLRHQDRVAKFHEMADTVAEPELPNHGHNVDRSLCALAVSTRWLGKFVGIVNAIWLIFSAVMEMVGGFEDCWCRSSALGWGSKAWVTLFKSSRDASLTARLSWGGSLALSLSAIVAYMLFLFAFLGTTDD